MTIRPLASYMHTSAFCESEKPRATRLLPEKYCHAYPRESHDWVYTIGAGVAPSALFTLTGRGAFRLLQQASPQIYGQSLRLLRPPATEVASGIGIVGSLGLAGLFLSLGPRLAALAALMSDSGQSRRIDKLSEKVESTRSVSQATASSDSAPAATDVDFSVAGSLSCFLGSIACGAASKALIEEINRRRLPSHVKATLTYDQRAEWLHRQNHMKMQATAVGALTGFLSPLGIIPRA